MSKSSARRKRLRGRTKVCCRKVFKVLKSWEGKGLIYPDRRGLTDEGRRHALEAIERGDPIVELEPKPASQREISLGEEG